MTEVYNYAFVGEEQLKKLGIDFSSYIRLANPIAQQHALLRQSLMPNLLDNIKSNQAKYDFVNLFEVGSIFLPIQGDLKKDEKGGTLPYQEKSLAVVMADNGKHNSFHKLKGILEYLFNELGITATFEQADIKPIWSDPLSYTKIKIGDKNLGFISSLNSKTGKTIGLKKKAVMAEISLRQLTDLVLSLQPKKYVEPAKYPVLTRDLAFVVSEKVLYNDIKEEIQKFDQLIARVELFDVFSGGKLGVGKKNLAFHLEYQADRTLKSEEVDEIQQKLIKHLEEKFQAQIRNF